MKKQCLINNISRRSFIKRMGGVIALSSLPLSLSSCSGSNSGSSDVTGNSTTSYVYISKASSYDEASYSQLKNTVGEMVSAIYKVKAFFNYGEKISIKVNIVGSNDCLQMPAAQTYITHPTVVKALCETLKDLGAGPLSIIEGSTNPSDTLSAFSKVGYDEVASYVGAQLIDLNKPDPYDSFHEATLNGGLAYQTIKANAHLFETDCLISVAKLKCHSTAGVTLSLKNLIGLLPVQAYGLNGSGARVEYVHAPDPTTQIPYNIIDLARLFPIDFAFIDGITSIDRGEGPWVKDVGYVTPGLLVAGDNPVAVDAVSASLMGFYPGAQYPNSPFVNCNNHIQLAADYNLGANRIDSIALLGEDLGKSIYSYNPPSKNDSRP